MTFNQGGYLINFYKTGKELLLVADPGFSVEGADLQRGCFSVKTYAKTKELDPVGSPPGSDNDYTIFPHSTLIARASH